MKIKKTNMDKIQKLAEKAISNCGHLVISVNVMKNDKGVVILGETCPSYYKNGEYIFIIIEKLITGILEISIIFKQQG